MVAFYKSLYILIFNFTPRAYNKDKTEDVLAITIVCQCTLLICYAACSSSSSSRRSSGGGGSISSSSLIYTYFTTTTTTTNEIALDLNKTSIILASIKAMHFHPHHSRPQSSSCTMVARLSVFGSSLSITQQTFIVTIFLGFSFLAFLLMSGGGGGDSGSSHVGRGLHISRRRLSVHSSAHSVPAAFGGIDEVGSLLHALEMVPAGLYEEEQKPGSGSGSGSGSP